MVEALPTLRAFVWLLSGVDFLMPEQGGKVVEALSAFCASIWFLPSVDSLVAEKGSAVAEALAAFRALKGSLSRMHSPVSFKV